MPAGTTQNMLNPLKHLRASNAFNAIDAPTIISSHLLIIILDAYLVISSKRSDDAMDRTD